jgi:tripeptidyl-peptidase-1
VSSGIADERITHSDNKGWLAFDATVAETEALLKTEYYVYKHKHNGHTATACDQYVYLDGHLKNLVDFLAQIPCSQAYSAVCGLHYARP